MEAERAKVEAEKIKIVNNNYKIFQEAVKADLDKPEDEVFNAQVDPNWKVRDALNANSMHDLFKMINKKI